MLIDRNKERLCITGLYKHKPDSKYRDSSYKDNLFHGCNWMFKPVVIKDKSIWMIDTYWSDGSGVQIQLTDENFDEFEFLFDFQNVENHSGNNIGDYKEEDYWHVALNSGGWYCGGQYVIRKGAEPVKKRC